MKIFYRYIRPYMKRVIGGMSLKFVGTVMDLLLPWLLAYVLDNVVKSGDTGRVYLYGGLMVLCALLALLGNVLANRSAASVARDVTWNIRHELFAKILRLSSREIDRFTIPSLISRMTTDTYYIYRMIGMIQRIGIRAPILLIGGIAITLTLDVPLTGLLVAVLPFMALIIWYISKKGVPLYAALQKKTDTLVRVVRENITGMRIIKALSKTEDEKRRFGDINNDVAASETKASSIMAVNSPIMQLLLNAGLVLVIFIGARRVSAGYVGVGTIIAFQTYFTIILNAMLAITRILTMYSKAIASAERVEEVLRGETEDSPDRLADAVPGAPHIEFRDVSFSYNKRREDLAGLSFALKRGQRLGILGPTGSGKSTVIKLLLRLYDADAGEILIDGVNVKDMNLAALRSRFGVVFQNDAVFHGTIGDNIRLDRELPMEDIMRAISDAQAAEYIGEKGGLDAEIVSRGQNLSGGQQQRLLIARALAGSPDILLLDDSSSALDFSTEAKLRQALRERGGDTTVITVAQRISAVMHCDQILVLEDGVPCGLGTHQELMQACDLYREIATLQIGGEDDAA